MKASVFFKNCKQMTKLRWVAQLHKDGRIILARWVDDVWGFPLQLCPISAVAVDVLGSRIENPHNIWESASALELYQDFTILVFQASCTTKNITPKVLAVREELITAVSPLGFEAVDIGGIFGDRPADLIGS